MQYFLGISKNKKLKLFAHWQNLYFCLSLSYMTENVQQDTA